MKCNMQHERERVRECERWIVCKKERETERERERERDKEKIYLLRDIERRNNGTYIREY